MAWLGFVTWITIYWCIFLAASTGIGSWALICGWLLPILLMTLNFREGMAVNGLMVLLCIAMFLFCRKGLAELRAWNTRQRKKHTVLYVLLYAVSFLLMFYCVAQAQIQGYMLNLQGWGTRNMRAARLLLTVVPMLALNHCYTVLLYNALDRLWCRRQELILLETHCYMASERGFDKLFQGYYLKGINNGVTYHFRLTRRTYYMLKKEKRLRLQIRTGLLGGLYMTTIENEEFFRRVRRRDRRTAKIAFVLFLVSIVLGVYIFWFI